jgi:phage-related protein
VANEGEASVKIVGDVRDFARDAEKDLNQALRKVKPDPVEVKVDTDALADEGKKAGEKLADGVTRGADGRLRNAKGHFVKEGEALGESLGEGITRGADGRLRNARGRFVKEGESIGRGAGEGAKKGFKLGFGDGFLPGIKNALSKVGDLLSDGFSGALKGAIPVVSSVATAVGGTFIVALSAVIGPGLASIVGAAVTALAGIGLGVGLIGLGALALKEIKPFQNALKDLGKTFKSVAQEAAKPLLNPLIKAFKDTGGLLRELKPEWTSIFKGLSKSIGPLSDSLGKFLGSLTRGIQDSIPGVRAALDGFGKGLEYLGEVFGDLFRQIFANDELIDNTTEGFLKFIAGPISLLGPLISGLNVVFGVWNNMLRLIAESNILGQIGEQILAFVDGGSGAIGRITEAWAPFAAAIQNVWDKLKAFAAEDDAGKLATRSQEVVQAIKDAWGPLGEFLGVVWDEALAFVKRLWEEEFVPWWNDTAKPWLEEAVKAAFEVAWNAAKEVVSGKIAEIRNTIAIGAASFVAAHRNALMNLPGTVRDIFNRVNAAIHNALVAAANAAGNLARNIVTRIRSALQYVHSAVIGAFAGAAGWLLSAGRQIMDGLVQGIQNGIGRVRSILNGIGDMIPFWKGPPSVDKVLLRKNGQLVMRGFVDGLRDEQATVQRTLAGLTGSLPDWSGGASTIAQAKPAAMGSTVTIMPGAIVINGQGENAGTRAAEAVLARLAQAALVR